jgi:hypothetical protein
MAVDNWVYSMERYFDIVSMTPTQQVGFAVNLSRDNASLWWQQFGPKKQEENLIEDWTTFCGYLRAEFKPGNSEVLAREQASQDQKLCT